MGRMERMLGRKRNSGDAQVRDMELVVAIGRRASHGHNVTTATRRSGAVTARRDLLSRRARLTVGVVAAVAIEGRVGMKKNLE